MASLLDVIRSNQGQAVGQQAPMEDQTQRAAKLLQAKKGKALPTGDLGSSSLGEQQAVVGTQQKLQELAVPAQAAQLGLEQKEAGIEQARQQQLGGIEQGRRLNTVQTKIQIDNSLNELQRQLGSIDQSREEAQKEQIAFMLRMDNKEYIDQLKLEGDRARLDNQLTFKENLAKDVFANNEALLRSDLNNKSILDATQRDFDKAMNNMKVHQAWEIYRNEVAAANDRAKWENFGNIFGIGINAAANSGGSSSGGGSGSGTSQGATTTQSPSTSGS